MAQATPLQQGTQQLLVVLHEPKEAAALARAIKQEGRNDRAAATAPTEFISEFKPLYAASALIDANQIIISN